MKIITPCRIISVTDIAASSVSTVTHRFYNIELIDFNYRILIQNFCCGTTGDEFHVSLSIDENLVYFNYDGVKIFSDGKKRDLFKVLTDLPCDLITEYWKTKKNSILLKIGSELEEKSESDEEPKETNSPSEQTVTGIIISENESLTS